MIKPVRKVKIIVPKENREELLITLQKEEIVMLPKYEDSSVIDVTFEDEIISRATSAIRKLADFKKKSRKFFKYNTVKYQDFLNKQEERITLLEDTEKIFDELYFLKSEINEEQKLIDDVKPFRSLKYSTLELSNLLYVDVFLGYIPEMRYEYIKEYASRANQRYVLFEQNDKGYYVLLYLDKDESEKQLTQFERFGFVKLDIPVIPTTINEYIQKKQGLINRNNREIKRLEKELTKIADNKEFEFEILVDQMLSQKERKLVIYSETSNDIIFNGWIDETRVSELQSIVKKVTLGYQIEFEEPTSFDHVPTLIKNNKFVQPFESITNTYSVPNYREIDPNPIMSVWYFILFGLMVGDIGYGLIMVVSLGLYLKHKKPKGGLGDLLKVMFYSGFSTTIAGVIYGSLFGADFNLLKIIGNLFGQNWNSTLLQPMNDPMQMLIFSIAFGSLHILTGLGMKMVVTFRRKDYLTGLSEGLSWFLIILGLLGIGAGLIGNNLKALETIGIVLSITGLAVMLVFGGLKKKGVIGKIFGGFSGIFKVTSYLNDLLSYSRVLALALSSAVIAFTFNTLASLVQVNIFGILASVIVYLIGHIFNFAVSLLSAYVHGNRLQYLEFYGKFYQGGGYIFEPLTFKLKHINEIKN